jgi:exosortase H (IPTLxxWG-CTERM-specific)
MGKKRSKKNSHSAATTYPGQAVPPTWWKRNAPVLRFGLTFAVLMALYYVVTLLPWTDGTLFPAYLESNAKVSNAILHWFGQTSTVVGSTIRSPQFSITIKRGCDALEPSWLFCAAVLAFPAPWRRRLPGIFAGVVIILALNLVRIVSLYFIGIHLPGFFEMMHLELWPVIFIFVALLLWIGWISWARRHDLQSPNVTA